MSKLKLITMEGSPGFVAAVRDEPFAINMIVDLYRHLLSEVRTDGTGKVIVYLDETVTEPAPIENLIDVLRIRWPWNPARYASTPVAARKATVARALRDALAHVARTQAWNDAAFEQAYDACAARDFIFDGTHGRAARNEWTHAVAVSKFRYIKRINVSVEVREKGAGQATHVIPYACFPAAFDAMTEAVGPVQWQSSTELTIQHKNKRDYWRVDLEQRRSEFRMPKADEGDAHAQLALGRMYLEGRLALPDRAVARAWLTRAAQQGQSQAKRALERLEKEDA
jgi:TPR repeat protein